MLSNVEANNQYAAGAFLSFQQHGSLVRDAGQDTHVLRLDAKDLVELHTFPAVGAPDGGMRGVQPVHRLEPLALPRSVAGLRDGAAQHRNSAPRGGRWAKRDQQRAARRAVYFFSSSSNGAGSDVTFERTTKAYLAGLTPESSSVLGDSRAKAACEAASSAERKYVARARVAGFMDEEHAGGVGALHREQETVVGGEGVFGIQGAPRSGSPVRRIERAKLQRGPPIGRHIDGLGLHHSPVQHQRRAHGGGLGAEAGYGGLHPAPALVVKLRGARSRLSTAQLGMRAPATAMHLETGPAGECQLREIRRAWNSSAGR